MGWGREGGSGGRGKINQCGEMILIRKNKSDSILDIYIFYLKLCMLLLLLPECCL